VLSTFLIGIFINYPAIIEASTTLHTQTNVLNKSKMRTIIISVLVLLCITDISKAQKPYIKDATVEEQLEFVEKEASKWQNYIMVFDTWFRQLKNNVNNTISEKNEVISRLETTIVSKDSKREELVQLPGHLNG
jgi:competence protein ComGC